MRITIDARMMGPENTRGIGRYIEELVRAMTHIAPEHRYVLAVKHPETSPFVGHPSVEHVAADVTWYGLAEQAKMPGILARAKPDLVHIPHWNVPAVSRLPRVVTIHDLILLAEPKSAKVSTRGPVMAWMKRTGYRALIRRALFASRLIMVPTQWVAEDIRRRFPSLKTPITVTGEGMPAPDPSIWSEPDTDRPYLLYVGSAYPHKNLDLLLDAWKTLAHEFPTMSLVLAGERDVFLERLEIRAAKESIPRVQFPGCVADADLPALYAKASAFVFPSRNEGFALTCLEALAYGCPVVASDASCVPEVLGRDGVFFFQPSGTDGIIAAVREALHDPAEARKRAHSAAAALNLRHSWKTAAERTLDAYERSRDVRT